VIRTSVLICLLLIGKNVVENVKKNERKEEKEKERK
jgi:hypothetical protein